MKKSLWPLLAVLGALLVAPSAFAAAPTGQFAPFKYCPYNNLSVQSCLVSNSTSGSFTLGNATVPVNKTITLQGGFSLNDDNSTTWFNAVGADTLSRTPLDVPGGLLGLMNPGGFPGLLEQAFENAVRAANGVTATAELVGAVRFDYINYVLSRNTAITLPIRIHLENPFLGPSCYIGSSSSPITLNLTDGTTAPPPPNRPITGSGGTVTSNDDGTLVTAAGNKLVDNSFAVPAASNCGYLPLDKILITAAVNAREGLPSAAGRNTAVLQGTTLIGDASAVRASVQ